MKKVCIIWKLREILDLMNFKKGAWRRAVQHLGERSGSELSTHAPVVPERISVNSLTSRVDDGIIEIRFEALDSMRKHCTKYGEEYENLSF